MILVTSMCLSQLRSLDIVTLGTYQQIHFRFLCYGEEILRGNESLEFGNMKDLTFCWVEVHVRPLPIARVYIGLPVGYLLRTGSLMHTYIAVPSAKSRTLDLICCGRSFM